MILVALLLGCGPATFTDVQDEIFTPSCAFSVCHGGDAGELDLTEGNSYDELVNVAAAGVDRPNYDPNVDVSDEIRVIPGDPEGSYLIKKCVNAPDIKGSAMPDDTPGLDDKRVALLSSWIENGALDD